MQITLPKQIEDYIEEKVKTGKYADAGAVIRAAFEALEEQEDWSPEYEAYLRRELQHAQGQVERGEVAEFSAASIIAEARRRSAAPRG